MGLFAMRVDVDSTKGLNEGVPPLLELLEKYGIKASFFINMGREWNISDVLKTPKTIKKLPRSKNSIGLLKRQGYLGLLKVLVNPFKRVGESNPEMIRRIKKGGYEIGLHGGGDHARWLRRIDEFTYPELENFIKPSYLSLKKIIGEKPKGFTSPGFKTNPLVLKFLREYNFLYCSDSFGDKPFYENFGENEKFLQIPLTVHMGNTVIEHFVIRNHTNDQIKRFFDKQLELKMKRNEMFTFIIHPIYEPLHKIDILEFIIGKAIEKGYRTVTFEEIAKMVAT